MENEPTPAQAAEIAKQVWGRLTPGERDEMLRVSEEELLEDAQPCDTCARFVGTFLADRAFLASLDLFPDHQEELTREKENGRASGWTFREIASRTREA